MVELVHQMSDIARRRERPLKANLSSDVDIRIVLALALIQLFQPELYRILRRRVECFPSLLTAFIGEFDPDKQRFVAPAVVDAHLSNIDLWRWAIDAGALNASATTASGPSVEAAPVPIEWSSAPGETEYHFAVAQIAKRHAIDRTARANAQLVRLPIVAQIVEHRAAQRHVFDVLKLMRALADSFAAFAPSERALKFAPYLSLLAEQSLAQELETLGFRAGEAGAVDLTVTERDRKRVDVAALADDLLSRESATQANLATRHVLSAGEKIDSEALKHLAAELTQRLDKFPASGTDEEGGLRTEQRRLLTGLQYLAPFVDRVDGSQLWALVRDSVGKGNPSTSDEAIEPKLRALWGDVRSAFGCDDRFDPNNFYLLKNRFTGHDKRIEPIPGFVLIPAGPFVMGHASEENNQPRKMNIDAPFYICRTLVTVDQFALFLEDKNGAYGNGDYWDVASAAWLKEHSIASRFDEMSWSEQRRFGSRPVTFVSWFDARAYARWLNAQLRPALERGRLLGHYEVMLPTETQWERAARAANLTTADGRRWPWPGDDRNIVQRSNVSHSVGGSSAAGLYPPNPIGLHYIAGNVWEWTCNSGREVDDVGRRSGYRELSTAHARRGGSWRDHSDQASCTYRYGLHPDGWGDDFGFRVVLSLAENET